MRYELTDFEWAAIKPMLPNKPRGVPRVDDRRVLHGIFWALRSGAPCRVLLESFGPYTTCYKRFVRWRRAGVQSRSLPMAIEDRISEVDQRFRRAGGAQLRKRSLEASGFPGKPYQREALQ